MLAKGLDGVDEEAEKGFTDAVADEDAEKGFEDVSVAVVGDFTPNRASPMFDCCGFFSSERDR